MRNDTGGPPLGPAPMATLPPGRKRLSPRWWNEPHFEPAVTLLARAECRQRRVAKPLKHDPDVIAHKEARRYANWCWIYAPENASSGNRQRFTD
jgi:hypothetical protein